MLRAKSTFVFLAIAQSEVIMSQLIEIIRRLLIAAIWIFTIGVSTLFGAAIFTENKLIAVVTFAGLIVLGWIATKIVNWIFSK